jgi:hypothetical protein
MALIGNYTYLNKNVGRLRAGGTAAGDSAPKTFGNFQKNGAFFNFSFQDGTNASLPTVGFPDNLCGKGWHIPINFTLLARSAVGSAAATISASGLARLVASAEGAATLTIDASGSILATVKGEGAATITISGVCDAMALAWLLGNSTVSVTADAPPLGLGFMEGTTEDLVGLTPAAIAAAVWNALAAQYNASGTMGEALGAAGTAGDPWTTPLPGSYGDGTAGKIIGAKLLTLAKFMGLK